MLIRSWKTLFEHMYDMQQNDWVNYLSDAEFAVNNYENVSISITSFFADHNYHFWIDIELSRMFDSITSEKVELVRVNKIIEKQEVIRKLLVDHITWAQTYQDTFRVLSREHEMSTRKTLLIKDKVDSWVSKTSIHEN